MIMDSYLLKEEIMKSDFNSLGSPDRQDRFFLFFLTKIKGLGNRTIWQFINGHSNDKTDAIIQRSLKNSALVKQAQLEFTSIKEPYLTILDADYPVWLANIYDPPLWLYYRGNRQLLQQQNFLTIVGSRTLTHYHQQATEKLIKDLANSNLAIVSGLAIGIDSLSHQSALNNNLATIAVLGSGLDESVIYPQNNIPLARQIITQNGLLLSEYPANSQPQLHCFPKRNRILAGLSKATVVISGALKSGTLITAQVAIDEGREVLALPGNINYTLNQGPNSLIANGAKIINSANDILKIYNLSSDNKTISKIKFTNKQHAQIYSLLQTEPLTLVELAKRLSKTTSQINILISELEIQGLIKFNQFNQIEII